MYLFTSSRRQTLRFIYTRIWYIYLLLDFIFKFLLDKDKRSYLIAWTLRIKRVFRSQHSRGNHDTDKNHISEVAVIAEPVAEDTNPMKINTCVVSNCN